MLRFMAQAGFASYKFNQETIKKLAVLLGTKAFQANEQIQYFNNVRVIDENNKLIGVLTFEEARRKAEKLGKDIIMTNADVKPAVCKICDYSDELAARFLSDVLKKNKVNKSEKSMKLGHKITIQDLKIKVHHAQDLLKKQNSLRVNILVPVSEGLQAKNVLYTFRDLCMGFMVPIGDIKTRDYEKEDDFTKKEDEEDQVILEYTFESLDKVQIKAAQTQQQIERQITAEYTRRLNAKKYKSAETKEEFKQIDPTLYSDDENLDDENLVNENVYGKGKRRQEVDLSGVGKQAQDEDFDEQMKEADDIMFNKEHQNRQHRLFYMLNQAAKLK